MLGGLGGLPSLGRTGWRACLSHVPDTAGRGHLLVFGMPLIGMDAKMAQYVRGKAFTDHVVGAVGMERFNTIWTGPETLPRPDEIDEPDRWIARVL